MIDLSTEIRTYAITAGGKGTDSYQGKMLQYAQQYQQAIKNGDDPSTLDDLSKKIKALVQAEKKQIEKMEDACINIKTDVGSFKTATVASATNLTQLSGVLKDDLDRPGGLKEKIEKLREDVTDLKKQYDADEKELKKGKCRLEAVFLVAKNH